MQISRTSSEATNEEGTFLAGDTLVTEGSWRGEGPGDLEGDGRRFWREGFNGLLRITSRSICRFSMDGMLWSVDAGSDNYWGCF
jgi:hypothetical protein